MLEVVCRYQVKLVKNSIEYLLADCYSQPQFGWKTDIYSEDEISQFLASVAIFFFFATNW